MILTNNIICGEKSETEIYEIDDFRLNWLEQSYFILYIYNTDNKDYKKIYNPLPGKNYTFEYDFPNGTMKRVQKAPTKQQRKCQK